MKTFNIVMEMAKDIEKTFNTKCYVSGKGVRKLLKRQTVKKRHFDLIISPNDMIDFEKLKDVYGEMLIKDNEEITLSDIKVFIQPLKKYLSNFSTDIQKIYIDSNKNISSGGLLDMKRRKLKVKNIEEVVNTDKFINAIKLRYEGFSFDYDDLKVINKNITNDTLLKILKLGIEMKSPNIMRSFNYEFNGVNNMSNYRQYIDLGGPAVNLIDMLSREGRTPLNSFIRDLFYEYGEEITEKTGLTEYNFFNVYNAIAYIFIIRLLQDGSLNAKTDKINVLLINMEYSKEDRERMIKEVSKVYNDGLISSYTTTRSLEKYYVKNNYTTSGDLLVAISCCKCFY